MTFEECQKKKVCDYGMNAERMFFNMGYVKGARNHDFAYILGDTKGVRFDLQNKNVKVKNFGRDKEFVADMNLLKAINKQCEELGWLDEC